MQVRYQAALHSVLLSIVAENFSILTKKRDFRWSTPQTGSSLSAARFIAATYSEMNFNAGIEKRVLIFIKPRFQIGRNGGIRTRDPLHPI
ncbi:hypothetical protein [Comamonas sp.]|uniref:hypothetical protein n=1 Tax=Comamonas sp. TaxID=34028 RepID=UPI002FC590C1